MLARTSAAAIRRGFPAAAAAALRTSSSPFLAAAGSFSPSNPRPLRAAHQARFCSVESKPDFNPFEVFEDKVGPESTDKEIKEAYNELVRMYHPDINPDADPQKIVEVTKAYKLLIRMKITGKIQNKWFQKADGDEPPVPRSELQERVYKPAEAKWEEANKMRLYKIKKKLGAPAYYLARFLFVIVQYMRAYRVIVGIMCLGLVLQMIRGYFQQQHAEEMRKRREKANPNIMLTLAE